MCLLCTLSLLVCWGAMQRSLFPLPPSYAFWPSRMTLQSPKITYFLTLRNEQPFLPWCSTNLKNNPEHCNLPKKILSTLKIHIYISKTQITKLPFWNLVKNELVILSQNFNFKFKVLSSVTSRNSTLLRVLVFFIIKLNLPLNLFRSAAPHLKIDSRAKLLQLE